MKYLVQQQFIKNNGAGYQNKKRIIKKKSMNTYCSVLQSCDDSANEQRMYSDAFYNIGTSSYFRAEVTALLHAERIFTRTATYDNVFLIDCRLLLGGLDT